MSEPQSGAHPDEAVLLALAERAAADPDGPSVRTGATGAAQDHVAGCVACQAQLEAYRSAARLLAAASPASRGYCPPREDLARDAAELGATRAAARSRHVAVCPHCRADLGDLHALEAAPASAPSALGAAAGHALTVVRGRLVLALDAAARALRVLESTLTPLPAPPLATARGADALADDRPDDRPGGVLCVEAVLGAGTLEVTWAVARGGLDLRAQARGAAPTEYRLALAHVTADGQRGAVLESRTSDERGAVTLAGVDPGRYLLSAYGPQRGEADLELELELIAEPEVEAP